MNSSQLVEGIILHLGGESVLARIGATGFILQGEEVSLQLNHENPKGVHTVVISPQPGGRFGMKCFGRIAPGTLTMPLLGSAQEIIPENLASVLGKLTGIESIHHRHY